jgi:aminopeptidase N
MNRTARVAPFASLIALSLAGCSAMNSAPPTSTPAPLAATAPVAAALPEIPSDLPRNARPLHYAIAIKPDIATMKFEGTAAIDLDVTEATSTLTLHAADLAISSAKLTPLDGGTAQPLIVAVDAASQHATFTAPAPIVPGRYRIDTSYTGVINTQANGLFVLEFPDKRTGKMVKGLFTQFEAPDARRFAPMFDEPIFKATFDLFAVVPTGQMAVSNMPVATSSDAGDGMTRVTFHTSPKMSSYLLFFAVGDFERLAKDAGNGVEVGIVSPKGSGEQARFALDALAPLVPYYADYFGQPFPLPKLDNVAGPGQSQFFAAMENWGAVFTFERILLDNPAVTSAAAKQVIFVDQAHEVAHQWFGDLVTMQWWDDLWLNEGFASWMENKATDHFHPEWFPLLNRVGGREAAMAQDAFATTHPIVQRIRTVEETNQAFDNITYQKGEAVIAMLEAYAGENVWRDGIRAYMRAHAFGNSRTEDLWRAVESAGAPGLTAIARDFTTKPGIPLVRVRSETCAGGRTRLTLEQGEFSRDRTDFKPLRWKVPLLVAVAGGAPQRTILEGKTTMDLPGCGPVVINAGQLGYYRSVYTPEMLARLTKDFATLAPIDQLGLMRDNLALAVAGTQPVAAGLDLIAAVPVDANPVVAGEAIGSMAGIYRILDRDPAARARVLAVAGRTWEPRLRGLGFDVRAGEPLVDTDLRAALIESLGQMGDPAVVTEARRRFAMLGINPHALDGPLKQTWLEIVARHATRADWDALAKMAATSTSSVERPLFYTLLGRAADPALARAALDLALTDAPGKTTGAAMISAVSNLHSDMTFDFVRANKARVDPLVDNSGRARFLADLVSGSTDPAMVGKLEDYAKGLTPDNRKPVDESLAALRARLISRPHMVQGATAWLAGK